MQIFWSFAMNNFFSLPIVSQHLRNIVDWPYSMKFTSCPPFATLNVGAISFFPDSWTLNFWRVNDDGCFQVMESTFVFTVTYTQFSSPMITCSRKFPSSLLYHSKSWKRNYPFTEACVLQLIALGPKIGFLLLACKHLIIPFTFMFVLRWQLFLLLYHICRC